MIYCNGDSGGVQEKYEGEWVEGRMHGRYYHHGIRELLDHFVLLFRHHYYDNVSMNNLSLMT